MHDLNLASRFSDRMLMLKQGCIFAVGTPQEVITQENIEAVYGIKANVSNSITGSPQVTPLITDLISHVNGFAMAKLPPTSQKHKEK
jgi:ABC-type hemin transport system ATPase subunit